MPKITEEVQRELLNRLKRIEGQARGIQRMVEEGRECAQIANQLASMRAATQSASIYLLRNYARFCWAEASEDPAAGDRLDDLIDMMVRSS